MKKILNKKGFTLIELVVVIAILAILSGILIPSIMGYVSEAEDARDMANARSMYTEAALAIAVDGTYTYATPCTNTGTITDIGDFTCTIGGVDFDIDSFSAS